MQQGCSKAVAKVTEASGGGGDGEPERKANMAKVNLNPVLEGIRGSIGDLVFKHYGEEVIVGRKPDPSNTPPTAGQ